MCNKWKDAGKRGGDILHSYQLCPLVKCNRYHQLDHISKNCTNPRGCLFVYISFQFSLFMRLPHTRATVEFRSVFHFFFFSGGLRFYHCRFRSPPPLFPLSFVFSFQLSFSCVRRTPLLRYKFRFRVSVYFPSGWSFAFSCTSHFNSLFHAFAARPCYGINFVSVFQFIFLSGGLRDPWATPLRVPQ